LSLASQFPIATTQTTQAVHAAYMQLSTCYSQPPADDDHAAWARLINGDTEKLGEIIFEFQKRFSSVLHAHAHEQAAATSSRIPIENTAQLRRTQNHGVTHTYLESNPKCTQDCTAQRAETSLIARREIAKTEDKIH
jgi:hypothetical protein